MKTSNSVAALVVLAFLATACAAQEPAAIGRPLPAGEDALASAPAAAPSPQPPATPVREAASEARMMDRGSGLQARDFELTLFSGDTLQLSDLRGKVVALNFWGSYCAPCRWEMPAFEHIWQEYRDQGLVIVGVASVLDTDRDALDFAEKVGVTYPLGRDSTGQITRDYRVLVLPTTVLIDRQGNEARKISSAANEAALRIFLKTLLTEG